MPKYDSSLWELLKASTVSILTIKARIEILHKILDGLIYIQINKLVHLDIKPSNIMLKLNGDQWDGETIVITDFGLCSPIDALTGMAGTPGFGSPEQFIGQPSQKSDNYAVGKLAVMVMFPWQLAWNLLAQPLGKEQISEVEKSPLLSPFHKIISDLLNVSKLTYFKSV